MNSAASKERPEAKTTANAPSAAIAIEYPDETSRTPSINTHAAWLLRAGADLIEAQGGDGFRERAYRAAAATLESLERPLDRILAEEGREGLMALPTIGTGIAAAIAEIVLSGRWSRLDRLRGTHDPERLFMSVPGVGRALARRLVVEHRLETLEEFERALRSPARRVRGIGPRRREAILAVLVARLGHPPPASAHPLAPSDTLVLEIDAVYRAAASTGRLRWPAADASAPAGIECVPVMHRRRDGWDFSAMYAVPPSARGPDRTVEAVDVHYQRDGLPEGRCTVVDEPGGEGAARRVVRRSGG